MDGIPHPVNLSDCHSLTQCRMTQLELPTVLSKWFGESEFLPHRVGKTLTVPIFMATGSELQGIVRP